MSEMHAAFDTGCRALERAGEDPNPRCNPNSNPNWAGEDPKRARDNLDRAENLFSEARKMARRVGHCRMEGRASGNLGLALEGLRRYPEASPQPQP